MQQKQTPLLKASGVKKTFHYPRSVHLLKDINLEVHPGETLAIMGRSGEGKSTLLHILGTLENPCEGSLQIAGIEAGAFNKSLLRRHKIGFIFQSFHLLEDYSTLENVLMPAKIARKNIRKGSEAYERGLFLLEQVGLSGRAHFRSKLLSGGEKQRVAIARSMCNNPDLILADEPSGNLDRTTAEGIHQLLLHFASAHSKTLILVTHDQELARLCQRRLELKNGILLSDS